MLGFFYKKAISKLKKFKKSDYFILMNQGFEWSEDKLLLVNILKEYENKNGDNNIDVIDYYNQLDSIYFYRMPILKRIIRNLFYKSKRKIDIFKRVACPIYKKINFL